MNDAVENSFIVVSFQLVNSYHQNLVPFETIRKLFRSFRWSLAISVQYPIRKLQMVLKQSGKSLVLNLQQHTTQRVREKTLNIFISLDVFFSPSFVRIA